VVNDKMREDVGKAAIGSWAAKEMIGDRVTMYVTKSAAHPGGHAVIARVTGAYDKISLPDPLELRASTSRSPAMRSRSSSSSHSGAADRPPQAGGFAMTVSARPPAAR
jgi:hypothetical protein